MNDNPQRNRRAMGQWLFLIAFLAILILGPHQIGSRSGVRADPPTDTPIPPTNEPAPSPTDYGLLATVTPMPTQIPLGSHKPAWPTGVAPFTSVPQSITATAPPIGPTVTP